MGREGRSGWSWGYVAALVTAALLGGPAAASTRVGGIADQDPTGDFLPDCDVSAPPQAGEPAMDLINGHWRGDRDGYQTFDVQTAGNASAFFSSEPESAAFVVTYAVTPNGPTYELIREIHEGQRRSEVEQDGVDVAGSQLLVDARPDGAPRFMVRGLEAPTTESRWAVTAFVRSEGTFCDRMGFDTAGAPALLFQAAPVTAARPATSPNADEDSNDLRWILWVIGTFGLLGVLALVWWFVSGGWRPGFGGRDVPPAPGSHGAPQSPPPEQNDFGK